MLAREFPGVPFERQMIDSAALEAVGPRERAVPGGRAALRGEGD